MKKNNILFIIDSLETLAGTEKQLLYMTAKLNSEDYSCLVCPLLPENSSAIQKFREVGIEVLPLAIERLYSIAAFKKLYMLKRIIKQRRIKIIQTFHFGSDVFGVFLAKLTSVPILISNRRDMGFTESRGYFRFVRRVINHAITRIISVSQNLQHYIAITERVNKRKLLTIYNGVDLEKYPKSVDSISKKKELGLNPEHPVIGMVANIRPIKGFEYFFSSASIILKKHHSAQFMIVGGEPAGSGSENKAYESLLLNQIRDLKIEENIFWIGYRTDIQEVLRAMDVFVLPSLSEGFSNAIIEAMAVGLPVVVTDVGGNAEAVTRNTGIVVPPRDVESLSNAVMQLLTKREDAQQLGISAKMRVEKFFSLRKMVSEYDALFKSLLRNLETESVPPYGQVIEPYLPDVILP